MGGADLRSVMITVVGLGFAAGLGWLIGLIMGAGKMLLLAPTSGHEVQAALQRLFGRQEQEQ